MTTLITTNWIKQLIKEEIKDVQKRIVKDKGNLRGYLDSRLPFSFYLDISDIRRLLLNKNLPVFQELAAEMGDYETVQKYIDLLDRAYIDTINSYIDGKDFEVISNDELASRLTQLANSSKKGATLDTLFRNKKTIVIKEASIRDQRVLLIAPSFRTISDRFGTRVKSFIKYDELSDDIDDYGESPRSIFKKLLENIATIQNIGHLQVEVNSEKERSSTSGIVTPRLINALLEAPPEIAPEKIAYTFAKETGQVSTRIIVNKDFNSAGISLELLVNAGFLIGGLETQEANLLKAPLEASFRLGKLLDAAIRKDPSLIIRLVSSKTILEYVTGAIANTLFGKSVLPYKAKYVGNTSNNIAITTVKPIIKKAATKTKKPTLSKSTRKIEDSTVNLVSLQNLINRHLVHVVSANMGSGDEKAVLNYRTGRLAQSASVLNLSMSREGMITAFYSYMKNPYATFSDGGRQQYPKSRDPKLLISQSIKEIAATRVANRMRTVVV